MRVIMIRYWLLVFLFALPSGAQSLPDSPSHVFFEKRNQIRLATLAGLVAADGVTTHHVLFVDGGRELNPLARPLVMQGAGGQVAASFLGYGVGMGTSYLFHKMGHHKMERMVLNLAIAAETECVVDNLIQIARTNRAALHAIEKRSPSKATTSFSGSPLSSKP